MTKAKFEVNPDKDDCKKSKKYPFYWAPIFCSIWFLLFYVAVIPSYYSYPKMLLKRDERHRPDEFIGERAQIQLFGLASIGNKLAGSLEGEVHAKNFLLHEIELITQAARLDLYDIEVDVQHASGEFTLWDMAVSYRNLSNIIVKIAPRGSTSQSYLLVNSHYDSEVGSPAAGDAGIMIVTMLETLRVISRSEKELRNPIVFLFNGGEESNLLASHGFIAGFTPHKWAPYCKAVINLDSGGSGGREIVFQSGPNNPWLMKYYKQNVPHPYASTIGEELFQNNFVPSDTDFRIFRDFGNVPGLDMAHNLNGYVYHTKYDTFANLERGTYQTTGENVLALTRAFANANELRNATGESEGHTVFFDYLGWFMVLYSEKVGIAINTITSIAALIAIGFSVYCMNRRKKSAEYEAYCAYKRFFIILGVQVATVLAAFGVVLLIGVIIAAAGISLAWYSEEWLVFGLYFCPMFLVLGMFQATFMHWTRTDPMSLNDTISCFMHAHCIILTFICLLMTGLGIRSAFFVMIAIFFYTISVMINLIGDFVCKKSYFLPIHLCCQLMPFWFYSYQCFSFLKIFVPMQGRSGPLNKPELLISGFCALIGLHFAGFLIPILHKFRKSKLFISIFGILFVVFIIIAATPVGFPFKKEVAAQRFYVLHTNRILHDEGGSIAKNESGFYIQPADTKSQTLDATTFKNALSKTWIDQACREEVFCGLPLYNSRWLDWKDSARWIPANPPHYDIPTQLTLTSKKFVTETRVRYSFSLRSGDRVIMYVDPLAKHKVVDWSFEGVLLEQQYPTPYLIYYTYSMLTKPLDFWIEVERDSPTSDGPSMRLSVAVHFQYHTETYTQEFNDFLNSFPEWAYPTNWVASLESWYF